MNNSYYNVSHSRDYYKGKSVEFAGEWTSGMRYFNDEYLNSLVVYTEKDATGNIIHSALLACKKTHIAAYNNSIPDSTNNQPHLVINDNLGVIGIEPNDYWIFVSGSLMGIPGKPTEIVNTYLEAVALATENNISKIVFVKEEKSIYFIVGIGELRKIVSTSDFSELFESKVDKEPGKGLSTNDYSNSEKEKLEGIEENAQRNIIEEVDLNGVKIEPVNKVVSINVDTEVTENSNNLVTSGAVHKKLDLKQDTLIAGNGIKIENNKIDVTPITESETQPDTSIWVNPTENTEVELTYNRSQIDTLISSKQDVIDDIDNIRRGAAKGASSLQSETDPIYTADKPNLALKSEIPDISVKVDKEEGKGLSSNDYTNEEKAKLASLENYNDTEIKKLINQKANDADLAKVAKTGKYSDLIDEPLIKSSQAPTNNEPLWVNPDEDPEEIEVYNRSQVDALLNTKQDTLIPGNGIIIEGNVISSTGGGESGGSIDLSSYAKKTDVEAALAGKQDIISDLADIKEGANKGKTALQSYNETDPIYTADKPSLATKAELNTKQNTISDLDIIRNGASKGETALQPIQNITYAELVALRDSSSLVAGMQYRITDYACTTTQANTQSAGHPFDIIVTADSENTLNEEARAIQHEGDTYFADCDLNAWKIWYCLDNDASRFAWADSANGKGIIYRMIDEWNNDVPYDFKNIMFKRYILDANNAIATDVAKDGELNAVKTRLGEMSHRIHTSFWYYGEYVTDVYPNAEVGRKYVPFGDILYYDVGPGVLCPINEANSNWFYTFSDTSFNDNSLTGQGNVHDNVVKGNKYALVTIDGEGRYSFEEQENICLNDIIFIGDSCHSNSFGNNCCFNSFGNSCYSNSFGDSCHYNSFGNSCHYNSFGNNCHSNSFESYCYYNSFGNECYCNSFGNNCCFNSFGNECYCNSFGNNCYSNSFGNNCCFNSFGNECYSNSFGNNCSSIKFASTSSTSTKYNYYQYNHFGDGCQYILFKGAETASSSAQVQNYNFAQGVQGTSSAYLTIDGVRSRAYETKVAKNSAGELKIYCEADLIQ